MSNLSFANKYRPQVFGDVLGQGAVVEALKGKIMDGRLPRTSMYCGAHGSGKTTLARIVAKAVNCENPQNGDPCCKCASCLAIDAGQSSDVIELDAASHNKVADAESIIQQVEFLPLGNKKVVILDEMHMLTKEAQNKLLKMVEEPPEHVLFIFCTTEENKVLPTILSRCNKFTFRAVTDSDILGNLEKVCKAENIDYEPDALKLITRSADGHVRDSLSVLEQLSYEKLTADRVAEVLGVPKDDEIFFILQAVMAEDYMEVERLVDEVSAKGSCKQFLRRIVEILCYLCSFDKNVSDNETEDFRNSCQILLDGGLTKDRAMEWVKIITRTLRDNRGLGMDLATRLCFLSMLEREEKEDRIAALENTIAKMQCGVVSIPVQPNQQVSSEIKSEKPAAELPPVFEVKELEEPPRVELEKVAFVPKEVKPIMQAETQESAALTSDGAPEDDFFAGIDVGYAMAAVEMAESDNYGEGGDFTEKISVKPDPVPVHVPGAAIPIPANAPKALDKSQSAKEDEVPFSGSVVSTPPVNEQSAKKPIQLPGGKIKLAETAHTSKPQTVSPAAPTEQHPYQECKQALASSNNTQAASLQLFQAFEGMFDNMGFN